jgi:hypothetical protein
MALRSSSAAAELLWLQLPVGAPPEQPSPKSINVFRDCRGYKPADKEPKYPWNYVAEWPAYSLLHIHHPQPDAYANRCLQKDHSIDTHYRSLVPDPGRRSMSAKPSCRKEKEGPAGMHATRAVTYCKQHRAMELCCYPSARIKSRRVQSKFARN